MAAAQERHKVVPAVLLVLEKGGKYLLQLRQNTGFSDNIWGLAGGHVDANEHILATVIREAGEELGVRVREADIELRAMHHYRREDGNDGVNFYFVVHTWEGEPHNMEPALCGGLEWFAPGALPENIFPELREVLATIPAHHFIAGVSQPRVGQGKQT